MVLVHEGVCEKQDVFYNCQPKSLTMWEAFILSLWSILVLNDAKFVSLFRHNCVNTYNKLIQEIECKPLIIELEFKLLSLVIQYLALASRKSSNWASTFLPPLLDVNSPYYATFVCKLCFGIFTKWAKVGLVWWLKPLHGMPLKLSSSTINHIH